ncbi:MAG: hypothetical protein ABI619_10780 [Betaproteobacteria bacterium]
MPEAAKVKETFEMKIRHTIIALSAALAIAPVAMAGEAVQATQDCASLQAQYDQASATASAEHLSQAKMARDEGEKLCSEGKTAEGAAKLQEAISHISAPMQPKS